MKLIDLCQKLDTYFNIAAFIEKDWLDLISETKRGELQRFLRLGFSDIWNGLMLENTSETEEVDRVYLAVFPTQNILDTIIAKEVERGAPGALIFTHHPLNYSEREAAFHPISAMQLEELQEHHICLYSCHAPLDCHTQTSTANALAKALGLEQQRRFAKYYAGYAGIHGQIKPTPFQTFAEKLAEVCELPHLRYDQCLHNGQTVQHIAIVPGGGNDIKMMKEAEMLKADTYVTGHWWLFGTSEFAASDRPKIAEYTSTQKMNFLGASHYSSEMVVMRDQMVEWFKGHNIEATLIRQDDAWQ